MKIEFDAADLDYLAEQLSARVLTAIRESLAQRQEAVEPLLFSERSAAEKLGISRWVLKRMRDAGEIGGRRRGERGKVLYSQDDLKQIVAVLGGKE